uniref:TonB-dependent receptor n=1 Tax=Conchiformibius kuhniae TaxID=211502 RepID=A0A8T9MWJ4_9NEIS|nr:TonB-dependent receptor [Conchiformibius kuhniae]
MTAKRWDVRGEWHKPLAGIDKIKLTLAHAQYHHDELHDGKFYVSPGESAGIVERLAKEAARLKGTPESIFNSKGSNARIEVHHRPTNNWQGLFGAQYTALRGKAELTPRSGFPAGALASWRRRLLPDHTDRRFSLFGLEQFRYKNLTLEAGARWEKQSLPVHYDKQLLSLDAVVRDSANNKPHAAPDLRPRKENALSYSGTLLWDITPANRLSFTASHNERIPAPMELYYHGKHFTTNSYEFGNSQLKKERSNNFELGWKHDSEKWDAKLSVYQNRFRNYIHGENIRKIGNIHTRRYIQSQARFNGIEGEVGYHFSPEHKITLFGDLVRGKLFGLPDVRGREMFRDTNPKSDDEDYDPYDDPDYPWCYDEEGLEQFCPPESLGVQTIARPNRNAPRVPPARLGLRWEKSFRDNWSASLEYTRVFAQNKVSDSYFIREKTSDEKESDEKEGISGRDLTTEPISEDKSRGYHLLNAGLAYKKRIGGADYRLSLDVYNLLNQKVYVHHSHLPYVPRPGRNVVFGVNVSF